AGGVEPVTAARLRLRAGVSDQPAARRGGRPGLRAAGKPTSPRLRLDGYADPRARSARRQIPRLGTLATDAPARLRAAATCGPKRSRFSWVRAILAAAAASSTAARSARRGRRIPPRDARRR